MNGGGGVSSVGAEGPAVSMGSSSHLQMVLQGGGLAGGARYPAPPPHPLHYSAPAPNPAPAPLYNNQPTYVTTTYDIIPLTRYISILTVSYLLDIIRQER